MGNKNSTSKLGYFPDGYKTSFEGKVIIIGAGVAGMTAGYVLHELGIEYEILEASDTYGGRVKKVDDFADFPIDLGAEWVHPFVGGGREIPFLKDILANKDPEFQTFKFNPEIFMYSKKTYKLKKSFLATWANVIVGDLKFRNATWFDVFTARVYPTVKDNIKYNTVVTEINYEGEKVITKTDSGTVYQADKMLVTVPITILQKELITFTPKLPSKKFQAIKHETVPPGFKVFMEFKEKFYPDMFVAGGLSDMLTTHGSGIYDAAFGKDSSKHILGFFMVSGDAKKYLAQVWEDPSKENNEFNENEKDKLIQLLLAELDKIFEGKPSKMYIKSVVQNWSGERFIQGSYSSMKTSFSYNDRVAPLAEKVYFAGEAMNLKKNMIAVHATAESSYLSIKNMLKKFEMQ